jgi:phospholipid/cholesterol/gamma-HCH transport system substrate-binding protein
VNVAQKRRSWRSAVPGLLVITVLLGLGIFILTYARVGALRGSTYTLYLPVAEARNVMPGTDVWLGGKRVGEVASIEFRAPERAEDPEGRLLLHLNLLSRHRDLIRDDSQAEIRSGGTLLGAPVININIGTDRARVLREGDTLRPAPTREIRDMMAELAGLRGEFDQIIGNVRTMRERAAGLGDQVMALDRDRQRVWRLLTRRTPTDPAPRAEGSLRLLFTDPALGSHLAQIMAEVDSVTQAIAGRRGTVSRLQHERDISQRLTALTSELDSIATLLRRGDGTAGRLMHDRALAGQMESLRLELQLLQEDFARWPERYVRF